jgi:hypothetical protein
LYARVASRRACKTCAEATLLHYSLACANRKLGSVPQLQPQLFVILGLTASDVTQLIIDCGKTYTIQGLTDIVALLGQTYCNTPDLLQHYEAVRHQQPQIDPILVPD